MRSVVIAGAYMTQFGKFLERNVRSLSTEAALGAVQDAGVEAKDIELVSFGNAAGGVLTGQEMIRAQIALAGSGIEGVPMLNVENACASASSAFHIAWLSIAAEQCDVALAIGSEKMTHEDKKRAFVALARAVDVEELVAEHGEQVLTEGAGSLFMDIYANEAKSYMERSGATQRDFAMAASKSHFHGSLNPKSQYRQDRSVEEVLESRPIAGPLTLLMCSPIGDGSAALVLCSEDYAKQKGMPFVRVLATSIQSGVRDGEGDVVVRAARKAFDDAGVGPKDVDVVELHDAASPAEFSILGDIGVAEAFGGPVQMVSDGETRLGGKLPVNTSGGLVSKGHPIGATGCAQLVELTEQLRSRGGRRQVEGARIGLAENAGGDLGNGPAAAVVTILGSA
ncbi:thiolase family protein [Myxococcota bacterium]|nr:thiolase family protein [Myxococcota bacterium]